MNLAMIPAQFTHLLPFHLQVYPKDCIQTIEQLEEALLDLRRNFYVGKLGNQWVITSSGQPHPQGNMKLQGILPALEVANMGTGDFCEAYKLKYPYMTGAMANGIASADLVIAMGRAGMLGSFGAAGLRKDRLEKEIQKIQEELGDATFCMNLIHSPAEEKMERDAVELYIEKGIKVVEASAFIELTPHIIRYRASGLRLLPNGSIEKRHKVIAKISREEVATKFMQAPNPEMLRPLVEAGWITKFQAKLAAKVSVADDITVEADSGGHTDNRPLVGLFPAIQALKHALSEDFSYVKEVRIGAAGGIGTPFAANAAFAMGASYIVSGSINQSSLEAGTSEHVKKLLAEASATDVKMAPAADMFEMGVELQVLKRGSMFAMKAKKLHEYYRKYTSLEQIPLSERQKLESQVFKKPIDQIWKETQEYFSKRDPEQIIRAQKHPKRKMALVFRWYLGLSSFWAISGTADRKVDYQIWCGPSMGSFNKWVENTHLARPDQRKVADIAKHILLGAAYESRVQHLRQLEYPYAHQLRSYRPKEKLSQYMY